MSPLKKALFMTTLVALLVGGAYVTRVVRTVGKLPEAYAAWDAGTLLVAYMRETNRWPQSWDDLLSVAEPEVSYRGCGPEDRDYGPRLRSLVRIDWSFARDDPGARPVTRPDGSEFPVVWEDPNEMISDHLERHPQALR